MTPHKNRSIDVARVPLSRPLKRSSTRSTIQMNFSRSEVNNVLCNGEKHRHRLKISLFGRNCGGGSCGESIRTAEVALFRHVVKVTWFFNLRPPCRVVKCKRHKKYISVSKVYNHITGVSTLCDPCV